jgi:actin-like ATPase involved in cell morphogenesis
MIKKNTKVIFANGEEQEELVGGIPLSKGEIVHLHRNGITTDYQVVEKMVDCYMDGEDQTVDITYTLQKI